MFRVCLEWVKIEGQSPLTVAFRYGVAPLAGLRFLDEAELQCGWRLAFQRNGFEGGGSIAAPPTSFDRFR